MKDGKKAMIGVYEAIPKEKISSEALQYAAEGIRLLGKGGYQDASKQFNLSLKLDPANSNIHFLNGLTYHLLALKKDGALFNLAKEGYELAIKFDPTNWMARYHLGLFYMDKKDYVLAQQRIADALLYNSNDPDMLYSMVVASYYARDPQTAAGVLSGLRVLEPDSERVLKATTIVMAALDKPEEARKYLERYEGVTEKAGAAEQLEARVRDWEQFYDRYCGMIGNRTSSSVALEVETPATLTSGEEAGEVVRPEEGKEEGPDREGELEQHEEDKGITEQGKPDQYKMAIVDVVIIRTEEELTTRKGVNLLEGLQLQFGPCTWARTQTKTISDPTHTRTDTSTFTRTENTDTDQSAAIATEDELVRTIVDTALTTAVETTKTITALITIPALTYSMNIFNSHTERSDILARPTLVALNGQQSEFFAGMELQAAAVGTQEGGSVEIQKEVGVGLVITPEFLDDGRIRLDVEAHRTFLTIPSPAVQYQYMVQTSKTRVHANVVMNFGESLILSGLSEKETGQTRDGVPLLQSIPIIQYLFSRKDTLDFHKSVLILITPRTPEYVYRTNGNARGASGQEYLGNGKELSELQARYSDWFKPYPNWASVFNHLQDNTLYREFRTGDVTMERWESQQTLKDRLKQALEFLYY